MRQLRNGERAGPAEVAAILSAPGPRLRRRVAREYRDVTGAWPSWWTPLYPGCGETDCVEERRHPGAPG